MMLDFINAKASNPPCSLCNGIIMHENCSPKGCTHVFHSTCFEDWSTSKGSADEYICPATGCSVKFTEIIVRKTPLGPSTKIVPVGESHQCPICCETLQKPIATPESCNHTFCYVCLREWSRVRHECPLDRGAFELILLSDKIGGPIVKRVTAPPVELNALEEPFEEIDTTCEICTLADDEAHLLLCDHCDRGYHTYCLPVPLSSVPPGDWFCPDCVRHGIGRNSSTSASPTTTRAPRRQATRRRRPASGLADREAVESDGLESDESYDGLSEEDQDDDFVGVHRISAATQRILRQRANSRYRGSRLLQDTILNLAERVLSEASARARHRQTQRQRVRRQLAAELTGQTRLSSTTTTNQRTLCLEPPTEPSGSAQIRLSSPSASQTRDSRAVRRSADGEDSLVESRAQARRRRLLVLSDSASEAEQDGGVQLSVPSLRRDRFPRRPRETDESDTEWTPSSSTAATSERAPKRTRLSSSTGSESPRQSTSQVPPEEAIPQTSRRAASSSSRPKKRKTKKVKRAKTKTGKSTKRKRRVKRRVTSVLRKKKKLTTAQRKIKKRVRKGSSSISSSTASSSFHQSPAKSSLSRLPRLSLFGSEPTCSLFVEDPVTDPGTEASQKPEATTSSAYRPTKTNLLGEIEAGQKSLFSFTTRHMNVNPDHSMSPIPVANQQLNGHAPSSISYNSPNMKITLPLRAPVTKTSSKTDASGATSRLPPFCDEKPTRELFKSESNTQISSGSEPQPSSSTQQKSENHWSDQQLRKARSVLKASLKPQLNSGVIDESTYRYIMERALFKVQQKDVSKVSDARISKLAQDYVDYHLRHLDSK